MLKKWTATAIGMACVVLTGAAVAPPAGKITVVIRGIDVEAHAGRDSTMGQYCVVQYTLPQGLVARQVERAILELYINVGAKARGEYINEAPMIEVFALTESPNGGVDVEQLDNATRAGRPVALGESRLVRIDITKIVRAHVAEALPNHGLAIGSLSGMREGDVSLVADMFGDGAIGRVNIYASVSFD